jgi:hypothetical protein
MVETASFPDDQDEMTSPTPETHDAQIAALGRSTRPPNPSRPSGRERDGCAVPSLADAEVSTSKRSTPSPVERRTSPFTGAVYRPPTPATRTR